MRGPQVVFLTYTTNMFSFLVFFHIQNTYSRKFLLAFPGSFSSICEPIMFLRRLRSKAMFLNVFIYLLHQKALVLTENANSTPHCGHTDSKTQGLKRRGLHFQDGHILSKLSRVILIHPEIWELPSEATKFTVSINHCLFFHLMERLPKETLNFLQLPLTLSVSDRADRTDFGSA